MCVLKKVNIKMQTFVTKHYCLYDRKTTSLVYVWALLRDFFPPTSYHTYKKILEMMCSKIEVDRDYGYQIMEIRLWKNIKR